MNDYNDHKDYIVTTLDKFPHLINETIYLIEKSFHYESPHKFSIDFAPLIDKKNYSNLFIITDNKQQSVLAHTGVLLKNLINSNNHISTTVALIGGIAVSANFRGKGLLKILLHDIFEKHTTNVAFFLLWSDLIDLYKKFNFHLTIGQMEYCIINSQNPSNLIINNKHKYFITKTLYKDISLQEKDQVKNLFQNSIEKKFTTFTRKEDDWKQIEKINSSDLYLVKYNQDINTKQSIIAYYFINKGQDLKNIVHELAVTPSKEHKQNIFSIIFQENYLSKIWLPEDDKGNSYYLKNINNQNQISINSKYMGLVRIGDLKIFSELIHKWSNKEITINSIDNQKSYINFTYNKIKHTESCENFLNCIFGPNPLLEWKKYYKPFYISGLDSI